MDKIFLKTLFHRIRAKNPKELKALFVALILALFTTLLFQLYLKKYERQLLTVNSDSDILKNICKSLK